MDKVELLTHLERLEIRRAAQRAIPIFAANRWTHYDSNGLPDEDFLYDFLERLVESFLSSPDSTLHSSGRFVVNHDDPEADGNSWPRFRISLEL